MSHIAWRALTALVFTTLLGLPAAAQELDAAKRADIERLLLQVRAIDMAKSSMVQVAAQTLAQLQQKNPKFTAEHITALMESQQSVVEENIGVLNELFVQLYHRHFSGQDIRSILTFYESDVGKRMLDAMPALTSESIDAGMQFGRLLEPKIEERASERLKSRGLSL